MEHLVDHLRDNLGTPIQGEHAVVPQIVIQRQTNVDKVELVTTVFLIKPVTMLLSESVNFGGLSDYVVADDVWPP